MKKSKTKTKKSKLENEIRAEENTENFLKIFCKTFPQVYEKGLREISREFHNGSEKSSRDKWPKNTSNIRLDLKRIIMNLWKRKTHLLLTELHTDRIKSERKLRKLRKQLSE